MDHDITTSCRDFFLGYGRVRVYNTQTLPSSTTIHDTQAQHLPVSRFQCGTGIGIQKVRLTFSIQIPGDPRLDRRHSVCPHLLSHSEPEAKIFPGPFLSRGVVPGNKDQSVILSTASLQFGIHNRVFVRNTRPLHLEALPKPGPRGTFRVYHSFIGLSSSGLSLHL